MPAKRKRGRPKGSRNKPKGEPKLPPFIASGVGTQERLQHGEVIREAAAFQDDLGKLSQPFRSIDILERWSRGDPPVISSAMRVAGEDFRRLFRLARVDCLHAQSLDPRVDHKVGDMMLTGPQYAIDHISRVLARLGGHDSPLASCVWYVLGEGYTLREWVTHRCWAGRYVDEQSARMALIGALNVMASSSGEGPRNRTRIGARQPQNILDKSPT